MTFELAISKLISLIYFKKETSFKVLYFCLQSYLRPQNYIQNWNTFAGG